MVRRTNFTFEDNTGRSKAEIKQAAIRGATKGALILEGATKLLTRVDTGDLRDSWTHEVDDNGKQVVGKVGSPLDYAVYREFGTGEFAENGKGRKGGWWYKDPEGNMHFTMGSKPDKSLRTAFKKNKGRVQEIVRAEMGGIR